MFSMQNNPVLPFHMLLHWKYEDDAGRQSKGCRGFILRIIQEPPLKGIPYYSQTYTVMWCVDNPQGIQGLGLGISW